MAAAALVLFLFDPAHHSFYPRCTLYTVTGIYCPGCGSLRALHSLAHGRLLTALHFNALLVLALPFLAWHGVRQLLANLAGKPPPPIRLSAFWIKLLTGVVLIFTVLRNLPFSPFACLSPGP
jgi:Protein of unknown function (DUF2752)